MINLSKKIDSIKGFSVSVTSVGIKKHGRPDLALLDCYSPSRLAGVFTSNSLPAAPVTVCRDNLVNLSKPSRLALIINSGCANACTGKDGLIDCLRVSDSVASALNIERKSVFPFSTGVILERLPVEKMLLSIDDLAGNKNRSASWRDLATAIMTTDSFPKFISKQIVLSGRIVNILGIAKGSGMIHPNMATMLAFILTDVELSFQDLQLLVKDTVKVSFNSISVDGDMSTNDSFVAISNSMSGIKVSSSSLSEKKDWNIFKKNFMQIGLELAELIVSDGEGATKLIKIEISGAVSYEEACRVGESVSNSPLVKTAFFAGDPNLGRILSAIGASEIEGLDLNKINVSINDYLVIQSGLLARDYSEIKAKNLMSLEEINLSIDLGRGKACGKYMTCDLSYDYIKINAEYRS